MQIRNVRFIIAAITTFSAYTVYVSRVNLSIAIIAMVEDRNSSSLEQQHNKPLEAAELINGATFDAPLLSQALEGANEQELHHYHEPAKNNGTTQPSAVPVATADNGATKASRSPHPPTEANSNNYTSKSNQAQQQQQQQPLNANNIFLTSKESFKTPLISQEKFHWSPTEQGHILGAFFYGYVIFQVPGARLAESVGAKWIIMAASAGSAVISLAFPLSTQLNSIPLLMVLRFVMGLCQSAFFPAAYVIFCRWLPERERSVLLPIMFIGSNMGTISTYILSSYLITSVYGWPSVFYLSGFVCALCSLLWFVFGSNGPEDNWFITEKELLFIETNVNNQSSESNSLRDHSTCSGDDHQHKEANVQVVDSVSEKEKKFSSCNGGQLQQEQPINNNNNNKSCLAKEAYLSTKLSKEAELESAPREGAAGGGSFKTPQPSWSKLLKSAPIWVLILSMYGNEWSNAVLSYELPTYLNMALNFPIEQNGVINSFFQFSYAVASPLMSSLGAYMLARHLLGMRKIHVRKLFQSLATFGQCACFASVPICGANRGLIIMFMFLAIVFKSCANAGDIMVSSDLSPEYAGTIFAFANSIGNTAGVLVPALAGVLVSGASHSREQWTPFWTISAAIMGISGLIFLVFGETRRQDFSKRHAELELAETRFSADSRQSFSRARLASTGSGAEKREKA